MSQRPLPQRASDWLLTLEEEPAESPLWAAFEAWRQARPENAREWEEIAHTWARLGQMQPGTAAGHGAALLHSPRESHLRHSRRALLGAGGAGIAASIILACWPRLRLVAEADYRTGTGQTRIVRLPDGSEATLGPESALALAFTSQQRRLRLLEGQGFFTVAPDPARPFRVETPLLNATALGTGFAVKHLPGVVEVAVHHGTVAVGSPVARTPLGPSLGAGEWVRVGRNGTVERGHRQVDLVAAWRQGQLVAIDERVDIVLAELRRSYRGLILIRALALERQRITGVYSLTDIPAGLEAVAKAVHARVVHPFPGIYWLAPQENSS